MRVLLTQSSVWVPAFGGANKSNRLLLEDLARRGHVCRAVVPATGHQGPSSRKEFLAELERSGFVARSQSDKVVFDVNGVEVHGMNSTADLLDRLGREISEFDPDWVLVSSEDPAQLLLEAAVEASERAIYVCHTTLALPFGPQGYAQDPVKAKLLRRTAGIVTVSHYLGRYIRRWGDLEAEVLPLLDYGRGPFPHLGAFDRGAVTMINPCAIKGIDIFLELARCFPQLEFAAVPTWGTTQQDREALEALPNVRLLAARDEIDEIFAQTRVLLVPSLWAEALGRVALEAMLRGIPVLAADVGGLPEAMLGLDYLLPVRPIEDYLESFDDRLLPIPVVPQQDAAPWRRALARLTEDREFYEALSTRARRAALGSIEGWSAEPLEGYLEGRRKLEPALSGVKKAKDREDTVKTRLAGLSPEKRALLLRRLREKAKTGGPKPTPKPASRQTILHSPRRSASESGTLLFPLSFAQRRLWFIDRLRSGHSAYNEAFALELRGELQGDALAAAVAALERRHELLRTRFVVRDDEPWQLVEPWRPRPLPCIALEGLAPELRRSESLRLAAQHHRQPFDLDKGPLFRIVLIRLDIAEHVLFLGGHHVVADGWSMRTLLTELGTLYSAAAESRPPSLPLLPIQYADYADWEQKWLASERMRAEIAFWKKRLAGAPTVLELPSDRPREAQMSHRGAGLPIQFPRAATGALRELARSHNVTLFMVGLAGFLAVIHRLTGESDLVVGAPLAGRRLPELERLVGFFVNMLALRVPVDGQGSVSDLIGAVRDAALEAYEHQDVPFEKLVEELRPERSMSHTPIFQQAFNLFQSPDTSPIALAGLEAKASPVDIMAAKFDLELYLEESPNGEELSGELIFATDLFDSTTVRRFRNLFRRWLKEAAEHPDQHLSDFVLLNRAERHQLCVEINDTFRRRPEGEATLWDLVVAQAGRTPNAPAVVGGLRRLSYVELIRRAEALAIRLRALGVGPEVPVGLAVGRAPEMVVALLGILAAGGAYVPLDPTYPQQRLAYMLRDALSGQATPVVVTERELRDRLPPLDLEVTLIDVPREAPTADRVELAKDGSPRPENLAYIMYTSGSTGRPKGVAVPHRGAVELVLWAKEAFDSEVFGGVLAATSISFDLSVYELFIPLSLGGRVLLAENALELPFLAASEEVTLLHTVPSAMATLVEGQLPPSVRFVQLGGEPLPPGLAQTIYRRHPQVSCVWNYYGPTEDTVWSTIRRMSRTAERVTIGRALANTRVYLVDENFHAVPMGRPGELLLGGEGQARGYRSRPGLTAERFVPDPFGAKGARLYRTGDLARFLRNGELDILGRIDHQVKVRGFRIELEEIRAVLLTHPSVQEALVVAKELSEAGGNVLIAYIAPVVDSSGMDALRRHLAGRLPEYMMPPFIMALERLPLLPNGKVDRGALPEPDWSGRGATAARAWANPVEELLAGIWTEVLGPQVGSIGRGDQFFELGGHSLLATRVISRIREVFGVELPLRELFESPTVEALATAVELARGERAGGGPPLCSTARPSELPLSFAQERLWFLDRLEPESSNYHIPAALRLDGELDFAAFTDCLNEIIARHEILRTTLPEVDGRPRQAIAPARSRHLPVVDLGSLSAEAREGECLRQLRLVAKRPFDLSSGPLLRRVLLRLKSTENVFALTFHHIVTDGWSVGVLVDELTNSYRARLAGELPALAPLPVQYADFALWQRAWLEGDELERQLAYWRRRLAGAPAALDLPTDRPRTAAAESRGARCSVRWPARLAGALAALGRRRGSTLFMTLLATFSLLLSRYSRQRDVVVGSPIANRNRVEIEGLIGFFVNTLALRVELGGDPFFEELLDEVRRAGLDAFAHQDLPFEKLVEELQPERHLGRTPVFQVLFMLENNPSEPLELPGLQVTQLDTALTAPKFDLTLSLAETENGLEGFFHYRRDLFDPTTVQRLAGHLGILLEAILENPRGRLSELSLLGRSERQQISWSWNDSHRDFSHDCCLHELFEDQIAYTPEAVAVIFEQERLSYQELNARANGLAHRLRSLGVGPEILVGICLERSLEMIVAILAVHKAGGAYVPLDPTYPEERLIWMLEDAAAGFLLSSSRQLEVLPALAEGGRTVLRLDTLDHGSGNSNLVAGASPDNLAYVIYTSGSTGRPKGVGIAHRQLVNYTQAVSERLALGAVASFATVSTIAADLGNTCLFPSLVMGGRLHVIAGERIDDPESLGHYFERHAIDCLKIVPSHLSALLASSGSAAFLPHRRLILGGEASGQQLIRQVQALAPECQIFNHYGPTEATVGVATWRAGDDSSAILPLGRPLANSRIHLLDPDLQPVPMGVPGELFIGGEQLARGYFRRPAQTAASFIPDPFNPRPGARLYGTGDLARQRPDGSLRFLGRLDHQVKIRGFRVEAGEVEVALQKHPAVETAVVMPWRGEADQWLLVAYVVAPESEIGRKALRDHLRHRLPEAMVPSHFAFLEALPLSPNGKVDRGALPAPESLEATEEETLVVPRTPLEELLAGMWAELLGVEQVGATSDFFELGGHSLLATQLVSRVRRACAVELSVRSLFEAPTVAAMAARVERARREDHVPTAPPIVPVSWEGPADLSFAQERMWLIDQLAPGEPTYNLPYFAHLRGPLDVEALEGCLGEIIRRHEVLRTTFPDLGGRPVQKVAPFAGLCLRRIDLEVLPGGAGQDSPRRAEAERIARSEAQRPFDLAGGPLLRATVVRLAKTEHFLLLTLHHIVSDAWSRGLLLRELSVLYEAATAKKRGSVAKEALPRLAVQYADFAHWQRQWLQGEVLETHLEYWRQRLSGVSAALELPMDRPRPAVQSTRGAQRSIHFSGTLSSSLEAFARRRGGSLFMVLLAGFQALLSRLTRQAFIPVGAPIANRNHLEVEELLGLFVNTLVFHTETSGDPSFEDLLERVRTVALEAYAYQDLPFEKLVDELRPERDLSRTPLFQVFIDVQKPPRVWQMAGLETNVLSLPSGRAKFDLELFFEDRPGSLKGDLLYSSDLFDASTIERLARQLRHLLAHWVEDPACSLSAVPLISSAEHHQMVVEWNATQRPPYRTFLQRVVEEWAHRAPEAPAVAMGGDSLGYGELNRRGNRVAKALGEAGVGPEGIVGIFSERSMAYLVAMLGIFKAGGAYLPVDPLHPADRIRQVLELSGSRVLIFAGSLEEQVQEILAPWSEDRRPQLLHLETLLDGSGGAENPSPRVTLDNLAYVIYTSGSTGVPKGAMLAHREMLNHLHAKVLDLDLGPGDVVAQTAPQSFDISVWQFLVALLIGARTEIFDDEQVRDPQQLLEGVEQEGVTVLELVPSQLRFLHEELVRLDSVRPRFQALRWLIPTGEALPPEVCRLWLELYPELTLLNAYGPAECADDVTHHPIPETPPGALLIPIGRPLSNVRVHVLDPHLRHAPLAVAGEVCVGGIAVGRGYLGDPRRTAKTFVPDPLASGRGKRLYRTGDLGRHRVEGSLEFLGRIDFQVKVHGLRIELGEIEARLNTHPAVRESVLLAREDAAGETRLVAYMATFETPPPSLDELREYLGEQLPAYMVPWVFCFLEELPLLPNGKVNRRALPSASELLEQRQGEISLAPRTPVEQRLAEVWSEVLGIESPGVNDNFFELGGHSLLATRLLSRMRAAFQVEISLRAVFEEPTIAALARRIEGANEVGEESALPPLLRVPRDADLPLSYGQQSLWFLDQLGLNRAAFNIADAFRLEGVLDLRALERGLAEVVRRHEVLRTRFPARQSGEPMQVLAAYPRLPLSRVDLSRLGEERARAVGNRLAQDDALRPFDLGCGPLLRIHLLVLGPGRGVLLFAMHHIISDGWSINVLMKELATLYQAFSSGRPSPLEELSVQYADFAHWQRQRLGNGIRETQLAWWKERLAGAPTLLELPLDRPRPKEQSFRGAHFELSVPEEPTAAIVELSQREEVTLFMTLLAAFTVLLNHHSGQEDILVASPVSNRKNTELESLIGFFVNTVVLRNDLSGNPEFGQLLRRVRDAVVDAHAHDDLPFDRLVVELQPDRDLSYNPLVQVAFTLEIDPPEPSLPDLRITPLSLGTQITQYDLILGLRKNQGGLTGQLQYSTDLFERSTMARLALGYETLLRRIAEQPKSRLEDLKRQVAQVEEEQQIVRQKGRRGSLRKRLKTMKRETVRAF